jgi:hypothetical protein
VEIVFDAPHIWPTPYTSSAKEAARSAVIDCLFSINKATQRRDMIASVRRGPDRSQITFLLPGLFDLESDPRLNALALEALLRCLCTLDCQYLQDHPSTAGLYLSGVRYDRTFVWDTTPALYNRTYGDCKTVTATRVAELRKQGFQADPVFRWKPGDDKKLHFHILVWTNAPVPTNQNGFEDPSKVIGMTPGGLWTFATNEAPKRRTSWQFAGRFG